MPSDGNRCPGEHFGREQDSRSNEVLLKLRSFEQGNAEQPHDELNERNAQRPCPRDPQKLREIRNYGQIGIAHGSQYRQLGWGDYRLRNHGAHRCIGAPCKVFRVFRCLARLAIRSYAPPRRAFAAEAILLQMHSGAN